MPFALQDPWRLADKFVRAITRDPAHRLIHENDVRAWPLKMIVGDEHALGQVGNCRCEQLRLLDTVSKLVFAAGHERFIVATIFAPD